MDSPIGQWLLDALEIRAKSKDPKIQEDALAWKKKIEGIIHRSRVSRQKQLSNSTR